MARTRGHRAVVALVTVPLAGGGVESLAVLADRQKEAVAAFLHAIPEPLRHPSERAGTELSEGFVRAIAEEVPGAELVIDRCQGARAYRACADTGRKQELTRLTRALPKAEEAELQGAMWPFRQRPAELKPPAWALRARVCTSSPKLEAAYHLREALTARFERADTKAGATWAIRAWCKRGRARGLAECESCLGTMDRWMAKLTTSCQGRQTSGVVEGFNNRVKVLKRRC